MLLTVSFGNPALLSQYLGRFILVNLFKQRGVHELCFSYSVLFVLRNILNVTQIALKAWPKVALDLLSLNVSQVAVLFVR